MSEEVERRDYLRIIGGLIGGLVIGGIAGYVAKPAAPAEVITETVEKTKTLPGETVTVTAPGPAAETITATVTATKTVTAPAVTPTVERKFPGVKLTLTSTEWIACPVYKHVSKWEEMTGAKVEIVPFPYEALYEKWMTDFVTGTGAFDLLAYPGQWIGDFAGGGWLENLDPFIAERGFPDLADLLPATRKVAEWAGHLYSVPYDGDCHMLYYRKDVMLDPKWQADFKSEMGYRMPVPPRTWEQVLDVATFFNGKDWDDDGETEYGIAFIAKRRTQAQWSYLDMLAQFNVIHGPPGKYAGSMYFDTETMEPLIKEPGAVEAMDMIYKLSKQAPPGLLGYGYSEFRESYVIGGVAVLGLDWGDVGIMEFMEPGSTVKGKLGYAPLPGAEKVWDRETGKWIPKYNHNNYGDFGGWCMGMSVLSKNKEAAFDLMCFLNDPAQSILDATGVLGCWGNNPYRYSHFDIDKWVESGFIRSSAQEYLAVIEGILSDPLHILDLKIPGRAEYYDELDANLARCLAGEISSEEACAATYDDWVSTTDELGKDSQRKLYRQSLGLPV